MKKKLRYFQADAKSAIRECLKADRKARPYVNLFTALGKSLVIADIMNDVVSGGKRAMCLVPRMELVTQNYMEAWDYFDPGFRGDLGMCCNKLLKMQVRSKAIVAMYQSIASKKNLRAIGKIDVLIIDECHTLGSDTSSVMRRVVAYLESVNPSMIVMGLTATHYRVGEGMLHEHSIYGAPYFTDLVYDSTQEPGIGRLIDEGYLAKIQTLSGSVSIDTSGIATTKTDFNQAACGVKFHGIIKEAVPDFRQKFDALGIETAIIFVSNLANGAEVLEEWGDPSTMRMVSGKTGKAERAAAVSWLKNGTGRRILVNAEILTTGFNFPGLQAVVMLRATISLGLLIQIIGRLIRPHGDKVGVFVDYGTNLERLLPHGLERIEPPKPKLKKEEAIKKPCTFIAPGMVVECGHWNHMNAKTCAKCGAFFNYGESEDGLYSMLSQAQILKLDIINSRVERKVTNATYSLATTKAGDRAVVATYWFDGGSKDRYLCFDTERAAGMAKAWLRDALDDYRHYIELGQGGAINSADVYALLSDAPEYFLKPKSIVIQNQKDSKYTEIYKIIY